MVNCRPQVLGLVLSQLEYKLAVQVTDLDFKNANQVDQLLQILDTYAQEAGGGNQEVSPDARESLPEKLQQLPIAHVLVAHDGARLVGTAICFESFSTFKAMPVLNIHDLAVLPDCRGQGIGSALLQAVAQRARNLGCCKVTLEVIESNAGARRLYERQGFRPPTANAETHFLSKPL